MNLEEENKLLKQQLRELKAKHSTEISALRADVIQLKKVLFKETNLKLYQ